MKQEIKNKLMNVFRNIIALGLLVFLLAAFYIAETESFGEFLIFIVCSYFYAKLANWAFKDVEEDEYSK